MIEIDIIKTESYSCYFIKGTSFYHREDGPAIIYTDGYIMWCLNGKHYNKEDWFQLLTEDQKEKMLYSEHFMRG